MEANKIECYPPGGTGTATSRKLMKVKVPAYDGVGPVEDGFRWWLKVKNIFKIRPLSTPEEKFNSVPQALSKEGSVGKFWEDAEKQATSRMVDQEWRKGGNWQD